MLKLGPVLRLLDTWVAFFRRMGDMTHDTSYRVSRARRMVGMIARSWSRGQEDKRGRSSPLSLPLRLRLMKGPC